MVRKATRLPNGARISDHVSLGVLTATVPAELVDAVLADTGRQSQRQRQLPARVVVYYVMALALYPQASYGEVLRCLLEGVRWLHLGGAELAVATKSAITRARSRLGTAPLQRLFERLACPFATPGAPGAWYRGRRLVSLDGTTLDLPDAPELEARYGRPGASRGASSYPQLRLLSLAECGTHAIFAVALGRYDASEVQLAPRLLTQLRPEMLCLADRAFVGFALWGAAMASGADLLWRVRTNQVLPCRQRLLDPVAAPAAELAALYHERWEGEGIFAELKVTLPGERLVLRSRRADLVKQEVYGLLLVHLALRQLMYEASRQNGCDPDRLSFLHTVRVVRRHLPFHAAFSPSAAPSHAATGADRDPRRSGRAEPGTPQSACRQAQDEQLSDQGPRRAQRAPGDPLP